MSDNIITLQEQIVKWTIVIDPATCLEGVPDGVYPFSGLNGDQWAVVVDEQQVRWARDYGAICLLYAEVTRVKREHAQRRPGDIPFMGEPVPYESTADDYAIEAVRL